MLIDFSHAVRELDLKVKGVIQVGAHYGQEYKDYLRHGIEDCVFIEPCKAAFKVLSQLNMNDRVSLYNCACADYNGHAEMFVSFENMGMSNSLLKPKAHATMYPHIHFNDTETVPVRMLDDLIINRQKYNLLVMDAQGAELMVLKGATETLKWIDYIYTEVNQVEMYEGNALIGQLDEYLTNFRRVKTYLVRNQSWGDAIYIRETLLTNPNETC